MNRNQEKMMKTITQKLKDGQIILTIEQVVFIPNTDKKSPVKDTLVITTNTLYFFELLTLRKIIKINTINKAILTPFSKQVILQIKQPKQSHSHSSNKQKQKISRVRIESDGNVRILKHILEVREKFLGLDNTKPGNNFYIYLTSDKSLAQYIDKMHGEKGTARFLNYFFPKKSQEAKQSFKIMKPNQQAFVVTLKDFSLLIGQKMYEQIYTNTKLLYINSDQSFLFLEENYDCDIINDQMKIFKTKKEIIKYSKSYTEGSSGISNNSVLNSQDGESRIMMRKIIKRSAEQTQQIAKMLINYRNSQHKQEIRYALETETHFEVFSPLHQDEKSMLQLSYSGEYFSEKDLRSVFTKLIEMIQQERNILCSLSLQNIRASRQGGIKISSIFSSLSRNIQLDYMAPQQLEIWQQQRENKKLSINSIQLINLWKAGMVLFQMAYGNIPFPIQILIEDFKMKKQEVILNFPQEIFRTFEFRKFLQNVLQFDPELRGGTDKIYWKQKILKLEWMKVK